MTADNAMKRITRIVQEHRKRVDDEHREAENAGPDELRDLDEWDADENDTVLRDVEAVVALYCAKSKRRGKNK